mmetsp:Transcript_20331/g.32462  ORF Transcript_20331/g.32462 Transcript_20331/m.32462 type:complete len:277 (-) Transcript_20331:405-1235(-)
MTMLPMPRHENILATRSGRSKIRLCSTTAKSCLLCLRDPASFMPRSSSSPHRMCDTLSPAICSSPTAPAKRPTPLNRNTMCAGLSSTRCHSPALGRCVAPVSVMAVPFGTRPSTVAVICAFSLNGSRMYVRFVGIAKRSALWAVIHAYRCVSMCREKSRETLVRDSSPGYASSGSECSGLEGSRTREQPGSRSSTGMICPSRRGPSSPSICGTITDWKRSSRLSQYATPCRPSVVQADSRSWSHCARAARRLFRSTRSTRARAVTTASPALLNRAA